MSENFVINGVTYPFPDVDDEDWGQNVTDWANAVSNGLLQKTTGGTVTGATKFGNVGIDRVSAFDASGQLIISYSDNGAPSPLTIQNCGINASSQGVQMLWKIANGGGAGVTSVSMYCRSEDDFTSGPKQDVTFRVATIWNGTLTERLVIGSAGAVGIQGTVTNDDATTGFVGEYINTDVLLASAVSFPTSGQWGELASVSLTPGDWDVTCRLVASPGSSTLTILAIGVSAVSGNTAPTNVGIDYIYGTLPVSPMPGFAHFPSYRVKVATTTTYYLKMTATYSGGTPSAFGRISARRVR